MNVKSYFILDKKESSTGYITWTKVIRNTYWNYFTEVTKEEEWRNIRYKSITRNAIVMIKTTISDDHKIIYIKYYGQISRIF